MGHSTAEKKEMMKDKMMADSMADSKADLMEYSTVRWKADSMVSH
jgi:hypothetical protein